MQRNAQAAYTVLKDAGLHLMQNNWVDGAHFEISLENTKHLDRWIASEGKLPVYWADFTRFRHGRLQARTIYSTVALPRVGQLSHRRLQRLRPMGGLTWHH